MKRTIHQFVKDERGVTAIEYALIAGLIAVVVVAAMTGLGTALQNTFTFIASQLPTG